jgi:hypothetical protein
MARLFVEEVHHQLPKDGHRHSGDVVRIERMPEFTLAVLADGMGSGIPANVAATLVSEYLVALVSTGCTLGEAMRVQLRAMRAARSGDGPWAAFSAVQIRSDGEILVYSYESPAPLIIGPKGVEVLTVVPRYVEGEVVGELPNHLRPGESLLLVSDGITQAGLGRGLRQGWGETGLKRFLAGSRLDHPAAALRAPALVVNEARTISQDRPADDLTAMLLLLRRPRILQVLTGPPARREDTHRVIEEFLMAEGTKAVCGGTTSMLVAQQLGVEFQVHPGRLGAPAHYTIEGIDLSCEGTLTLNRTNNVYEQPELAGEAGYGAQRLLELLGQADEVHFRVGKAQNPAHLGTLRPAGMLSRSEVVAALAEKLRRAGKLVTIREQ